MLNCLITCVLLQWVVQGAIDVNIGANPSAEGAGDDEGVDDQAVKVVDIVDTFRLQVRGLKIFKDYFNYFSRNWLFFNLGFQEQPPFEKKQFIQYMKRYIKLLSGKLEGEQLEAFKKNIEPATKFLLSKFKDLQL